MTEFGGRGGWWVAAQIVLLGGIAGALVAGPAWRPQWILAARLSGAALMAAGAILALAGAAHLGGNLTPYPAPLAEGTLVANGAYRVVRHPIYGGVVLGALGASVFALNPVALGLSVALVPFFLAKAAFEERLLALRYPGYDEYRRAVPRRLVPWLL